MKKLKIIYVQWKDHYSLHDTWGEADFKNTKGFFACQTAGFLVHESEDSLFISLNCSVKKNYMDCADTIVIVKSCIIKKTLLGYSEDPK